MISTLPLHLRYSIAKYLPIEKLLLLNYSSKTLNCILNLIEYVSKYGIIYVYYDTKYAIHNDCYRHKEISLKIEKLNLDEGWYKVRSVCYGIDIVKIGKEFISYHENERWDTKWRSRKINVDVESKYRLSKRNYIASKSRYPLIVKEYYPTFYILSENLVGNYIHKSMSFHSKELRSVKTNRGK
jgi:hypothetical protein